MALRTYPTLDFPGLLMGGGYLNDRYGLPLDVFQPREPIPPDIAANQGGMPAPANLDLPDWEPMRNEQRQADLYRYRNLNPPPVQKQRTGKGKVLGGIGDMLAGGIAAAATPNIAGGGAADVFRAMQAGGGAVEQRHDKALARDLAQQEAIDRQLQRQERIQSAQGQQDLQKAHADYYRAQAAKREPTFREKYDALIRQGIPGDKAMIIASGGTLQDSRTTQGKTERDTRIPVSPEVAKKLGVLPDAAGKYWLPENASSLLRPPTEPKPAKPFQRPILDQRTGNWQMVQESPEGWTVTDLDIPGQKPGKGEKKKETSATTWVGIEGRKNKAFQKAAEVRDKALNPKVDSLTGEGKLTADQEARIWRKYYADMDRAQDAYETEIRAAGGTIAPGSRTRQPDVPEPPAKEPGPTLPPKPTRQAWKNY